MIGSYQRRRLEEYDHQLEAKDRQLDELKKNRELVHRTSFIEGHTTFLNDEILKTHSQL
jgi:hypothetical protein